MKSEILNPHHDTYISEFCVNLIPEFLNHASSPVLVRRFGSVSFLIIFIGVQTMPLKGFAVFEPQRVYEENSMVVFHHQSKYKTFKKIFFINGKKTSARTLMSSLFKGN